MAGVADIFTIKRGDTSNKEGIWVIRVLESGELDLSRPPRVRTLIEVHVLGRGRITSMSLRAVRRAEKSQNLIGMRKKQFDQRERIQRTTGAEVGPLDLGPAFVSSILSVQIAPFERLRYSVCARHP